MRIVNAIPATNRCGYCISNSVCKIISLINVDIIAIIIDHNTHKLTFLILKYVTIIVATLKQIDAHDMSVMIDNPYTILVFIF